MKAIAFAAALSVLQLHTAEWNAGRTLWFMGYWEARIRCVESSLKNGEYVCFADVGHAYVVLRCSGEQRQLCTGRVVKS